MPHSKTSICAYCGCACKLQFNFDDGKIISTLPVKDDVTSRGMPCIKGLSLHESLQTNRLETPMVRVNGELVNATWQQAYDYIYKNLKDLKRDEVYFTGSGEFTNESNYLMSKFARLAFKTNNIDCCARLCHAATAVAFKDMFGITAIPEYTMDDLEKCDLFVMVGTDPKDDYPVMYHRIMNAKNYGAKIIVIDVGPSSTSADADLILKISPNGIVPLLSHLMNRIIKKRDHSKDAKHFRGFEQLSEDVRKITEEQSLFVTSLEPGEFEELYNLINHSKHPAVLYGMGATQQENGTQNVKAIASLATLLNGVLFSNRGKVNVQGSGEVGACPDFLPSDGCARDINQYWGIDIDTEPSFATHRGLPLTVGLYDEDVKAVWVMGMNPAHSMPDLNRLHKSLKNKFVIVQHHHPSSTMEFADVVLPTTMLPEEDGTISNGERRIRKVESIGHNPKIKPNWQIWTEIAEKFGLGNVFHYSNAMEVWNEIHKVVPAYLNVEDSNIDGDGSFADKSKAYTKFPRLKYTRRIRTSGEEFPFSLTTARSMFHFCSGEGTRNSARLMKLDPKSEAFLNPRDAESLGVRDGDLIKITSEVGTLEIEAAIDKLVGEKIVVLPYHFEKTLVNMLTPLKLDPESMTPCFKEIDVRIERV